MMLIRNFIIATALLVAGLGVALAAPPADFDDGKKVMYAVHAANPITLYCTCRYTGHRIDSTCPVQTKKFPDRIGRTEAEHIVPAADFGRPRACWRNAPKGVGGRKNCRNVDETFRRMEGDPYNLWPAIGSLNAIRLDHRYGEVPGEAREFGRCDFEISPAGGGDRFVEPPDTAKGIVARTYFYFEVVYGHRISKSQRRLFEAWNRMYPPTVWEVQRARMIQARTGMPNPVLEPWMAAQSASRRQ